MTPTMANKQLFFFSPLNWMQQTFFLLIRQRYDLFIWKWTTSWENLFLSYVNNKSAHQPAHPRSLISAFVVRCLDNNKLLQLKAVHIMHCISNLSVFRYMSPWRNGALSSVDMCVCMCINIFKHRLLWNHWADWSQISCMWSLLGMGERKFVQTVQVTWPRWLI